MFELLSEYPLRIIDTQRTNVANFCQDFISSMHTGFLWDQADCGLLAKLFWKNFFYPNKKRRKKNFVIVDTAWFNEMPICYKTALKWIKWISSVINSINLQVIFAIPKVLGYLTTYIKRLTILNNCERFRCLFNTLINYRRYYGVGVGSRLTWKC